MSEITNLVEETDCPSIDSLSPTIMSLDFSEDIQKYISALPEVPDKVEKFLKEKNAFLDGNGNR